MVSETLKTKTMIDKKKLIEELLDCVADAMDTETQITSLTMAGILMNEVLDEALNIPVVMHWVAVSERLPNEYQRVLVGRAGEANVMKVLTYKKEFDNKHWGDSMESHFASPTHWMPLPEPPCV